MHNATIPTSSIIAMIYDVRDLDYCGDHSHDILDHLGVERFDGFGHNDKKVYDGLDHLGVVDR